MQGTYYETSFPVVHVLQGFEYVVTKREQAKICFGAGTCRKTGDVKVTKVSPCSYETKSGIFEFLNKVRSRKGAGSLANGAPRFDNKIRDHAPSPTRYNLFMEWPSAEEGAAPFGIKTKRKPLYESELPGPGTYDICTRQCRRSRAEYNFGLAKMIDCVEEFCIPKPTDTCGKCTELCQGDYWHINYSEFLCQQCMHEENVLHEMYNVQQLKLFKKMRNCGYMHQHEGTTAAIRLLPTRTIKKKKRLEKYLDLYIKC
ncbi:protein pitchfork [Holotrichia oblita]|uniref:Protein pitchfork n=1 Tax=Holotrichia oblita TaxID=644536 RepID=A0ACB9T6X5_HOLOL|nr:protein pitchfork [Holotrichia oblita]